MSLVWHTGVLSPLAVPIAFSATYLFFIAYSLYHEGPRGYAYILASCLGGMLLYGAQPEEALVVAGIAQVVAFFGLQRSLMRVPHNEPGPAGFSDSSMPSLKKVGAQPITAGWPFGQLCPRLPDLRLPLFDAVCISILAGWLFYCGMAFETQWGDIRQNRDADLGRFIVLGLLSLVPLFRVAIYSGDCRPTVSPMARLATRRFVLPNYDRVYAAPVLAWFVIWGASPIIVGRLGLSMTVSLPIVLTLVLLALLVPGPTYRDWILTCECRILPQRPQQRSESLSTRRR